MRLYFTSYYCITHLEICSLNLNIQYVTLALFIPSQHPDFDVSFSQLLNGLWHAILQLVLHSCRSQQLKTTEHRVVMWKGYPNPTIFSNTVCCKHLFWSHAHVLSLKSPQRRHMINQCYFNQHLNLHIISFCQSEAVFNHFLALYHYCFNALWSRIYSILYSFPNKQLTSTTN